MTVHLIAKNKLYPQHLRYTCSSASYVPNFQNPYRQSTSATHVYLCLLSFVLIGNTSFEKHHSLKQSLNQKTIHITNFFMFAGSASMLGLNCLKLSHISPLDLKESSHSL